MGFQDAIKVCLGKYADFSGRALRSEYWWWILFVILMSFALGIIDSIMGWDSDYGAGALGGLFNLAVFIPSIAVAVRRLHDVGRTGWWYLLVLVPVIGWLVLIFWYVSKGDGGPNDYGPNPLNAGDPADAA